MHFSKVFTSAILAAAPVAATASPAVGPASKPAPLGSRQVDNNFSELGQLISALENLLTPETINNIGSIVNNAAALMTPNFVNQTQGLVLEASTIQLLPQLPALLGSRIGGGTGGSSS
ncbi:MAG: hypothetical protein M1822_004416 [Bathelium mastoideum]|nr:MAG: hypothetical protein M1822_004416 [Bathelium mastoideum]